MEELNLEQENELKNEEMIENTLEKKESIINEEVVSEEEKVQKLMDALETKIMEDDKKRKKHRMVITMLCLVTLIGTPLMTYGASYLGRQNASKQVAINQLKPVMSSEKYSTPDIAANAKKSVVEIELIRDGLGEDVVSAGSGVIISTNGYIATNYHVIGQKTEHTSLLVRLSDGTEYTAKVNGVDRRTDLAVIKVEAENLIPAKFSDSDKIVVGERAIAIGNSLGVLGGTVTQGIVSAVDRESSVGTFKLPLIQTDAPVNRGNSGGGLFNESGQLIGIVTQKASGATVEGLGFAIPSNIASEITKDIIQNGYVKSRPTIGINVQEVKVVNRLAKPGVYVVSSINPLLKKYDLIVEVNGSKITQANDILEAIQNKKVGDKIEVKVERDNVIVTVEIMLREAQN